MSLPSIRLYTCAAALLVVTSACGTTGKAAADRSVAQANPPTAPADADRMKRALGPIPAAQSGKAFRYGPVTGPYQQLMDRINEGKAWPSEPCAKQTLLPGRVQELGEQARSSPAALAMWSDEARALTVTETIINLTETSAQMLVTTSVPQECHTYDVVLAGKNYRATLKADELHQRDGTSERTQIWEYRAGKTTDSALQLTSRRGNYAILLSLSPAGNVRTAAYQDLLKQAEDHATAVLRQDQG